MNAHRSRTSDRTDRSDQLLATGGEPYPARSTPDFAFTDG